MLTEIARFATLMDVYYATLTRYVKALVAQ
mgnify:CR=1 FL=1